VFTHPQRFVGFHATSGTLFGGAFGFNFYEVRAFAFVLVFKHSREDVLPRRRCVAAVARGFEHPLHVEVFDRHEVVLPSVIRRELVQEVTPLALDLQVTLGDSLPLFLPTVRLVCFP